MIGVAGKNVVVTGIIPNESRATAQQRLREAGAFVHDSVTGKVDLLLTGAKVGKTKINAAEAKGAAVIPWEQIDWTGDGDGTFAPTMADPATYLPLRQIGPMLAAKGELPTGPDWSYEIKWDGYRCIVTVRDGAISMQSRTGKTDYIAQFPRVAAELSGLSDCIIDGEIVVLEKAGGSFAGLTGIASGVASFIAFDALESDGEDLRGRTLAERREALTGLLSSLPGDLVTASPVFDDGPRLLSYCAVNGLEGVVAKRLSSRYLDGARDPAWTKVKIRPEQEFVVAGFTAGEGHRASSFGALLLAYYDEQGDLIYCGKVGTGWDDRECARLRAALDAATPGPERAWEKEVVWVDPSLVVQVEFQHWTADGRLWHPSYKGQRFDKPAADVRREG